MNEWIFVRDSIDQDPNPSLYPKSASKPGSGSVKINSYPQHWSVVSTDVITICLNPFHVIPVYSYKITDNQTNM